MRLDAAMDPEDEELTKDHRAPIIAPGSDVAVNPAAPVVTGDPAMDTQLENLRRMLCARVRSVFNLVLRAKNLRLWAVTRKDTDHSFPPSLIKRDDHPLVAVLVRQAQELAKIDSITCENTVVTKDGELVTYLDAKLQLLQSQTRLKALSDIQDSAAKIEKIGSESLSQAQDLVKSFHAMAQQWRIHKDKMEASGADSSDEELRRIASRKPGILEKFLDDDGSGAAVPA